MARFVENKIKVKTARLSNPAGAVHFITQLILLFKFAT
jgi:hypothetical protein